MENKIAIIGNGEIGSSLAKVYKGKDIQPMVRDLGINEIKGEVDVLNICLPYSDKFVDITLNYIKEYNPLLTIIHSTIPVGTTKKICNEIDSSCVHSPVRGIHPNLKEGIETFVKFIGYNSLNDLHLTGKHYDQLGIKYEWVENTDSTEIAKMLSTTYYGLCIAFHGEMKKMCDEFNIDFEVINKWTETYNSGYNNLGINNVQRPNLFPPEGSIGGHCVIPNTELLMKQFKSKAFDLIVDYK